MHVHKNVGAFLHIDMQQWYRDVCTQCAHTCALTERAILHFTHMHIFSQYEEVMHVATQCVHMDTCMSRIMPIQLHTYSQVHMDMCMHAETCAHMQACIYMHTCIHTVHMCIYTCASTHANSQHVHTETGVCAHTDTDTHAHRHTYCAPKPLCHLALFKAADKQML